MASYAPFKPLVMYWTLHKDTKYWIGGYADATQGSMPEDRITAPFDGWGTLSNTTATDLARRMDQLVAGGVQYLHFGYLHLDQSKVCVCVCIWAVGSFLVLKTQQSR